MCCEDICPCICPHYSSETARSRALKIVTVDWDTIKIGHILDPLIYLLWRHGPTPIFARTGATTES